MHRNVIKTSNFAYRVLLVRRRISQKIYVAFCVPIGCVRFARYCGKIYRRHFFHAVDWCELYGNVSKQI